MARPCKAAKLLTECSQTKEEISVRAEVEEKLRGDGKKLKPPTYLNKNQKFIFKNIVKMLENAGILGEPDVYLLTQCSIAIDRLQEIECRINEEPDMLLCKTLLSAKEKYSRDFFRCCNELSLSPQSRAKLGNLNLQATQQANDPLNKILQVYEGGAIE